MPDLGEGLEDGEILTWHVAVGDDVALNEPVVEVETAKAVVTVPSPFAGRVVARFGDVGATMRVGDVMLEIDAGEAGSVEAVADPVATSSPRHPDAVADRDDAPMRPLVGYGAASDGPETDVEVAASAQAAGTNGKPRAKPPVRKLAKKLGVDLATLTPTGPHGTITRDDVRSAASRTAEGLAPVPGFRGRTPGDVEPIRSIRRRIVDKMEQSRRDIPAASCSRDVDLTRLWDLRQSITRHEHDDRLDQRITPFVLFMRATVLGLRRFPTLNATIVGRDPDNGEPGEIHLLEPINLGIAVDTDRGLVVPNIKHADRRSIVELAADLDRLIERSRAGQLTPDELTGGTFTVNNYGVFGNDDADPIINHPE
ncbi:MAG: dihydrolipoamide acetyltransferase family protein, partial [Nitriliruptoraceae bacterium]